MIIGECVRLGVMRKVITGIFEEKKFTLQLIFQSYFRIYITFFLFFKEFSYFFELFSCCPAELESIKIWKISLSVFELCKKKIPKIILNLT